MSASVVARVARDAKAAKASWSQAILALPAVLALLHSLLFFPYVIDDAYITYASARNLAHGFGPVFMAGERVEATSSMLWTLALAPFELLGVGSLLGSKLLGAACAVWVVLAAPALLRRMQPGATLSQQLTLGMLLAGCSAFVLWASYGMENGLVALLLLLAIERFGRELQQGHGSQSALPIFLLQTIRPEGFMFIALFVALRVLWVAPRPGAWRALLAPWLAWIAVCLGAYELSGFLYFGHLLPNTVAAKVGASALARAKDGVRYLISGPSAGLLYTFLGSCLLAVPALLGRRARLGAATLHEAWRDDPYYLTALLVCALQFAFTVMVGGDWMPAGRFVSHVAPLVLTTLVAGYIALAGQAASASAQLPGIPRLLRAAALLVLLALGVNELRANGRVQASVAALQRQCDHALPATVSFLNARANAHDTVAVADIGYVGYRFKGRVYDWWGLANEEITQLGQALGQIDPATVLKHRPRFIVLYSNAPKLTPGTMENGIAVSSRPFLRSAEFLQRYRQVHTVEFSPTRHHVTFERVD